MVLVLHHSALLLLCLVTLNSCCVCFSAVIYVASAMDERLRYVALCLLHNEERSSNRSCHFCRDQVVIAGAGPVGLMAALHLAQRGYQVKVRTHAR